MALMISVRPRTLAELTNIAFPAQANQPECIPWVWFDQENITSTTSNQTFFATIQTDPTLGNIQQPNTISSDQWWQIFGFTLDYNAGASQNSNAAAQQLDDLLIIQETCRTVFLFTIGQKQYVNVPITFLHASGGVQTFVAGTPASNALFNYAQNYAADGGYYVDGALVVPPRQTFSATTVGVATTLTSTRGVRISMHGVLYRGVR